MTISTTASRISYTGNGSTDEFSFPYPLLVGDDLVIIETVIATGVETVQVITTDYTVALVGGGTSATVTAVTPPASTVTWTIYRAPALTQATDFTDNDPLPAASIEELGDRLTMIAQRQANLGDRTLRQPEGDTADLGYLPSKMDRASKYLLFDSYGNPTVSTGTGITTPTADLVTYSQGGTGHVARTVEARLRDQVSVMDFGVVGAGDETTEVIAAVAAAAAAGTGLYWPAGTYTVTSSIPLLHTVKHTGPGVISSGGNTFRLEPKGIEATALYVDTGASLTNDGLNAAQACSPKQAAVWLQNYGPVLDGTWTIWFTAGTYTQANTGFDVAFSGFKSTNRVIFKGPSVGASPAVPTAIFDGTGGAAYEHGLRLSGVGFRVTVQDLKFINFTGSNSRIGLVGDNEVDLNTVNIHADSCDWAGVYASTCVHGRVTGGIINACRSGVIFNATNGTVSAVDVTNCTESGIYWSRGSQGHIDYCTLTSNAIGAVFGENSRCDTVDNTFTTNQYGIRTNSGGVFGEGGVANTFVGNVIQNIDYKAFSGDTGELNSSETEVRVASDRTTRAHSGAVATDIATVHTIPAHRLSGSNKTCRVVVSGIFNSTTAGSALSIKFGGMTLALAVVGAGSGEAFTFEASLYEVSGGYRAFGDLSQNLLAPRKGTATAGFDKTIDQDVIIAATLANAGDSMTIYRTDVFITG